MASVYSCWILAAGERERDATHVHKKTENDVTHLYACERGRTKATTTLPNVRIEFQQFCVHIFQFRKCFKNEHFQSGCCLLNQRGELCRESESTKKSVQVVSCLDKYHKIEKKLFYFFVCVCCSLYLFLSFLTACVPLQSLNEPKKKECSE